MTHSQVRALLRQLTSQAYTLARKRKAASLLMTIPDSAVEAWPMALQDEVAEHAHLIERYATA